MLLPDLVRIDQPWTDKIKQWFPLKINRFAVHNGEVHYGDFNKEPKVDVVIDRVQMVATNLTNSKKLSEALNADIMIEGRQLAQVICVLGLSSIRMRRGRPSRYCEKLPGANFCALPVTV